MQENFDSIEEMMEKFPPTTDQVSIEEHQNFSDKQKEIQDNIGTKASKQFLHMYWNDVVNNLSPGDQTYFISDCFKKLTEVYNLGVLDNYLLFTGVMNYNLDFVYMIKFFESDAYLKLARLLPRMTSDLVTNDEHLNQFLHDNYNGFLAKLLENKKNFHYMVIMYFETAAKEDAIKCLLKMIKKDTNSFVSEQIVNGIDLITNR